ncbi:MAG TPA: UDP-N-acetylmuramoyl-L-alanyl-D-glutamate--2,6-diaminopimelate ligase [Pyrinomonadaceae bacterium]|jgi:UDP-N-acetylmuramoyl-L-alanyl-D-glutamate--2,6-diaminopimelate ligase
MRLGELWECYGKGPLQARTIAADLFIFGVTEDSRDVRFGYIFCAVPGAGSNGLAFCSQAAAKGAQAIAVPEDTPDDALGLSQYEFEKVVVLRVADIRLFHARLAAQFHPGRPGTIAAVTGTNGKTSTVSFLRDLWGEASMHSLSLGTLGLRGRDAVHTNLEAGLTTFDAKTLHIMLGELAKAHGVTHLAMEASSHALDQQRLAGLSFDAAGFTNLTQDHLDYHTTMEAYFQAKARLFDERLKSDGVAVVNVHNPWGRTIASMMMARGIRVISYGEGGNAADLRLLERVPHPRGQTLTLSLFGTSHELEAPVAGIFQGENILCALGLAIGTGVPVEAAVNGVPRLASVPGRLERVAVLPNGAAIYVDYAHTPDALDNVLRSVRPHVGMGAKLHVVFGCGGDRDPTKRPIMGRIAMERADNVWVTDDNPRTEDPAAIRAQVLAGATGATEAGPRLEALQRALSDLRGGDVLVVAGKGHEDYQILLELDELGTPIRDSHGRLKTYKTPFYDPQVIREIAAKLT